MKKFLHHAKHLFLGFLAIALLLFMGINLILGGTVAWLNTANGQQWIKGFVAQALEGTNYQTDYKAVFYSPFGGLTVTDLVFTDAEGPIAQIDVLSLHIDVLPLAAKQGIIAIKGGHAILYRLPPAEDKAEDTAHISAPPTPFATPDIFFSRLTLNDLAFERLEIREGVFGTALDLAPRIAAKVEMGETINLTLSSALAQLGERNVAWLPETLAVAGTFTPSTLEMALEDMTVKAGSYALTAKGRANIGADGEATISLTANAGDLSLLAAGQEGSAQGDIIISGKTQSPDIGAKGNLTLQSLIDKGLSDILFTADIKDAMQATSGHISISTSYKNAPFEAAADIARKDKLVEIANLAIRGPDLKATGNASIDPADMMATGRVTVDASRLESYAALAGVDIAGRAKADITFMPCEDRTQSADTALFLQGIKYESYKIKSGEIKTALRDIKMPWPHALDVALRGIDVDGSLSLAHLNAKIMQEGNANYRLTMDAAGRMQAAPVTLTGGAILSGLQESQPTARDIDLRASLNGAPVLLKGRVDQETADVTLTANKFPLGSLPFELHETLARTTMDGKLVLSGPLAAPVIAADITTILQPPVENAPPLRLMLDADVAAGKAAIKLSGAGTGIETLTAQADFPLALALRPFSFSLPPETPLSGKASLALDGKTFAALLLPPDHVFSGKVHGDVTIAGTIGAPDARGTVSMKNGAYLYEPYDVDVRDIALTADIERTRINLRQFSANDGEQGTIQSSGIISLMEETATRMNFRMKDFHLLKGDKADATISADITAQAVRGSLSVGGGIDVQKLDITIPGQFQSNIPELNIVEVDKESAPSFADKTLLNIDIRAPKQVFVRGWGLDAEFGGTLDLRGTLAAPDVQGELATVRGRYEEFGKRFEIEDANLRFQGAVPPSPYLNVKATTLAGDVDASVLLTGPVARPKIAFSSVPALPQDEVLSRILFGKTMNKITPFQAIQLTQTLARLSGQGGAGAFNPLDQIRNATGLDDISVDTDDAGDTSVGVGKYLTEKVYLELKKGSGEASGAANISVEVTPSISVESEIGQDAQGGGGVFWSHDY